jgi:hypothetical protein
MEISSTLMVIDIALPQTAIVNRTIEVVLGKGPSVPYDIKAFVKFENVKNVQHT